MGIAILASAAAAQQRKPAFEAYGLTGGYFHGNLSIGNEWKPQVGGGLLAPLGRKWGILADVVTSAVEGSWNYAGYPSGGPGTNFGRERRIALIPAAARLWRRDRYTVYAGAGFGMEHERQHARFRPIVGRGPDGDPIAAPEFQETRTVRTDAMVVLRTGAIVSVNERIVARFGVSVMPRYADESASKTIEFGLGYRF